MDKLICDDSESIGRQGISAILAKRGNCKLFISVGFLLSLITSI